MFDELKQRFLQEVGWDKPQNPAPLLLSTTQGNFLLRPVAQIAGFKVFFLDTLPERKTRVAVQQALAAVVPENLCVYENKIWQFAHRPPGKPIKCVEKSLKPEIDELIEQITLDYQDFERGLTTSEVAGKIRDQFHKNTEKVTKQFFVQFKKEQERFAELVEGMDGAEEKKRYAGIVLNRLMFVYFLQKKGFLFDHRLKPDHDYLKNRLGQKNYFREFLQPLFFQYLGGGISDPNATPSSEAPNPLFGKVPYLNGGIFEPHPIEIQNPGINVPNRAFENVFGFFDKYKWHLDDRPDKDPHQINPDVIGYIFEKYINDRAAMGAYYTQEDVTEYIAKNTLIPFLFHKAGFENLDGFLQQLVQNGAERYIYPAVKHGINPQNPIEDGLPDDVKAGIDPEQKDLFKVRAPWNKPASPKYALPTEIWRETIARRKRYLEIANALKNGNIRHINDFVSYNLDIRQFAQDVIAYDASVETVRKFYDAIRSVTVLDPTCGSGAFLFAALGILEPLYDACLNAMRQFVQDFQNRPQIPGADPVKDFKQILDDVQRHPNPKYFVYKSIILNNLYGVDLMDEAVEIAKLRLFLKLASAAEVHPNLPNLGLEPLPDIDFNIRAGNTLVGFAKLEHVQFSLKNLALTFDADGDHINQQFLEIRRQAQVCAQYFKSFLELQTLNGADFKAAKSTLRNHLHQLAQKLDRLLAATYGDAFNPDKFPQQFQRWLQSHKPFHWAAEFYHIVELNGGFDVVIGNPPYVEYPSEVNYKILDYSTLPCGNLYAFSLEKVTSLVNDNSRFGQIIPVSIVSTPGYKTLRQIILNIGINYISTYNIHPSSLFEGAYPRLAIICSEVSKNKETYITTYRKWFAEERKTLFDNLYYSKLDTPKVTSYIDRALPKISGSIASSILKKIYNKSHKLGNYIVKRSSKPFYYRRAFGAFILFYDFMPEMFDENGNKMPPTELKEIFFNEKYEPIILGIYHSNLFYFFTYTFSDCRNINKSEIEELCIDFDLLSDDDIKSLSIKSSDLHDDLLRNSQTMIYNYKTGKRTFQVFYPRLSKPIIDEIDRILAGHYGFTEEELDYIVNYDIKYRMGKEDAGE